MTVRNIKKNLAGAEDLLHGIGVEAQSRGGASYDMHKLDTYVPTYDIAEMQKSALTFMRLYGDDTQYTDYRRNPAGTVGIPSDLGGVWEPIRTSELQIVGNSLYGAYVYDVDQVMCHNSTRYSWSGAFPKSVTAGSTPSSSGGIGAGAWVDRTQDTFRSELSEIDGDSKIGHATYQQIRDYAGTLKSIRCGGRLSLYSGDGGHGKFYLDDSDTSSADNDATILIDALGRRWKRKYSGNVKAAWAGVIPSDEYVHTEFNALITNFNAAEFKPGTYKLNGTVKADNKTFKILGSGQRDVFFEFYSGGQHLLFTCHDGGYCDFSGIDNVCIRNKSGLASSALSVLGKIGNPQPITSFTATNFAVNGYTQAGCNGVLIDGIETSHLGDFYIQADKPVNFSGAGGVDTSTISDFYLYSTNGNKNITILSQVSDVSFENGVCVAGSGCAYIAPTLSTPTNLTFRNVRSEQPISTGVWAYDIVSCANLIKIDGCTSGGSNGVRATNAKHVTINDSLLGFNYGSETVAMKAYSFTSCEYVKVSGVRGDGYTTYEISGMLPKGTLRQEATVGLVTSGEWTSDAVGSWSYSNSNGVDTLSYKVTAPPGPLAHRIPIDSPIVGAVSVDVIFKSTTTTDVEIVNAVISEGSVASAGASANSGVFTASIASKVGLLFLAGAGVFIMNNTALSYDCIISVRK